MKSLWVSDCRLDKRSKLKSLENCVFFTIRWRFIDEAIHLEDNQQVNR